MKNETITAMILKNETMTAMIRDFNSNIGISGWESISPISTPTISVGQKINLQSWAIRDEVAQDLQGKIRANRREFIFWKKRTKYELA